MNWSIRRKIFLALFVALSCIVLVGFLQSNKIHSIIVRELGGSFAKNHILWQKERLKGAVQRELSLSRAMASSETIQQWAMQENATELRKRGISEIEGFRRLLRSGSWFAVFDKTKNYYYNDGSQEHAGIKPLKTLEEGLARDAWYFVTLRGDKDFTLNVDYDKEVNKTNLWINIIMQRAGSPIGILGTGLDITGFVEDFVVTNQSEVQSFILNADGSIFVSQDERRMNMRILAKGDEQRKKIYSLIPEQKRKQLRDAVDRAIAAPEKIQVLKTSLAGTPHIVALSYIPSLRWVAMSAIDDTGIFDSQNILSAIIAMIAMAAFVLLAFSFIIDKLVITPVKELTKGAESLRRGEYSTRFTTTQDDEIGELKNTFNTMAEEIQSNVSLLEHRVAERTKELGRSRDKIATLLNSSGEGFLKFAADGIIDNEYSSQCQRIFNRDIAGLQITDVLFPHSQDRKHSFTKILKGINDQPRTFLKEIMLDLLPGEVQLENRYYGLRFLLDKEDEYILMMADITERKELSRQIQDNERYLSFVVEFVRDESSAKELISDFEHLCDVVGEISTVDMYRKLHTFKGNFLQKGFIHVPWVIHEEEGKLQKALPSKKPDSQVDTAAMRSALQKDLDILRNYLGDEVVTEKVVKVHFDRLKEIAHAAESADPALHRSIMALFKSPLRVFLQQFEKTIRRVARDAGKDVRYELDCPEDILVYFPEYNNVLASMYHLITNGVVHGIELPEIRAANGKAEQGIIRVVARQADEKLVLEVSDDGKGIDLSQAMVDAEAENAAGSIDQKDASQMLFQDGVSSSAFVSLYSGRGAGMSSVKSEIEKAGGAISVTSADNTGTKISISIPLKE